VTSTLIYALSN